MSVVVLHDTGMPEIASVGPALGTYAPAGQSRSLQRASLNAQKTLGIVAETANGFAGRPGLVGSRDDGTGWSPRFELESVESNGGVSATFLLVDAVAELGLRLDLGVDHVLTISATLTNLGATPYNLIRLAPSVPVPPHAEDLVSFSGRWCREFQTTRTSFEGLTVVENRRGRTSAEHLPAIFAGSASFGEQLGEVWGIQLAWSGNYEIAAERLVDDGSYIQAGELLSPGEVRLAAGQSYTSPDVVAAWSPNGLTEASQRFHSYARSELPKDKLRPVILNTWEAVYFDHDLATLEALADDAATVGVERFVLDDGWFGGRRDDTAGLGDWWVSPDVWPDGLSPIVDHVIGLGMGFGLWVEPEMVNPDSNLYRAHPEWTLATPGYEPPLARNQLVLDLGRTEVREFLFDAIDALLNEYEISYLKWDMNRDIVQGSHAGRAGAHEHVLGFYALVDQLRAAHRHLEIESCSSGGGRADLGVLRRTERIWASDCNDALERQLIQNGFTQLFPPEVMGAHIGPERAHTTARSQDFGFRAATALFGHMGIEWNLLDADPEDLRRVAAAVALHKRLRPLLHRGDVVRVDHPDTAALVHGVVSGDGTHAVFAYVQLTPSDRVHPCPMRFPGLDSHRTYRVSIIDDLDSTKAVGAERPAWMETAVQLAPAPLEVTGAQLAQRGLQPPVQNPESVLLIELAAVG